MFGDVGSDLNIMVTMKRDNIEQKVKISFLVITWELMSNLEREENENKYVTGNL